MSPSRSTHSWVGVNLSDLRSISRDPCCIRSPSRNQIPKKLSTPGLSDGIGFTPTFVEGELHNLGCLVMSSDVNIKDRADRGRGGFDPCQRQTDLQARRESSRGHDSN